MCIRDSLGATYAVHLRLIGKLVVDFLLVIIELFWLSAFVLSQSTRLTDGQTDRQTDRMLIGRPRLHSCSAVIIIPGQARSYGGTGCNFIQTLLSLYHTCTWPERVHCVSYTHCSNQIKSNLFATERTWAIQPQWEKQTCQQDTKAGKIPRWHVPNIDETRKRATAKALQLEGHADFAPVDLAYYQHFLCFLFESIAFWEVPRGNHKCRSRDATPLVNNKLESVQLQKHCISNAERHCARRCGFFGLVWCENIVFGRFANCA